MENDDITLGEAFADLVSEMNDSVNHPSHYTRGKIEVADFIEDQGLNENAWLANAIKYICRAGYKSPDTYVEDLEKAVWYLNREITRYKNSK